MDVWASSKFGSLCTSTAEVEGVELVGSFWE